MLSTYFCFQHLFHSIRPNRVATSVFLLILVVLAISPTSVESFAAGNTLVYSVSTNDNYENNNNNDNNMKTSNAAANTKKMVVHWFRMGDMRLHDNPALHKSIQQAGNQNVLPVFCFDPRIFGDSTRSRITSDLKCGPKRAQFVLESVADLRSNLEAKGSGLLIAHGKPEEFLDQLYEKLGDVAMTSAKVICQEEVSKEEQDVVRNVQRALISRCGNGKTRGKADLLETVWGSTMYDIEDLPYNHENGTLSDLPDTFTPFRNKVEKTCQIRSPFAAPNSLKLPFAKDSSEYQSIAPHLSFMPTLKDLGYSPEQIQESNLKSIGKLEFKGGETAALARMKDYIWVQDRLKVYFDTRNGMLGEDYSTKFSPWLAHGNLSPRLIAQECKRYEQERVANKSTYWVVFELLWRDYFKFFALKHGNNIFLAGGTTGSDKSWKHYEKNVQAWRDGKTGYPLVDANMRELAASGFMSNRGRQNVASFLALELNQDWRHGAEYFENILLDYDIYSNWGNWCAAAGMTGGRVNRFNIVKQSKDYDQHGDYVKHWCPELKDLPKEFVHSPWKMTQFQMAEYNCQLGVDYPNPIAKPAPAFNNKGGGGGRGGGGRGGRGKGGRVGNDRRQQGGKSNHNKPNANRGRGQQQDMKSLKKGSINMD